MKHLSGRLVSGSAWLTFSRASINALSMLSTIVLAWALTPADFGLVAIATTILVIVGSLTELSLAQSVIRLREPTDEHLRTAWTLSSIRGAVICALVMLAATPLASLYDEPRLVEVLLCLAIGIFVTGLANPRQALLQRDLIFRQDFILNVSQKLVAFVVAVVIAMTFHTYWALVLGTVAGQITSVLLSYALFPFRPRFTMVKARELLSFSVWLTAGQIVNTLNWRFDHLLIGKVMGNSALGYYTVGSNLASLPTRESIRPLTQAVYPGLASIGDDRPRLASAYQRAQSLVTAIALPAGIGVALLADRLVPLLLGPRWSEVTFVVQALASVFALQTLGSLVQPLGMATGHTRLLFVRDTQMFFLRLPIIIAGMLLFGLTGVVVGRVASGLISTFVNMQLVSRLIGVSIWRQVAVNRRSLLSILVMTVAIWAVSRHLSLGAGKLGLFLEVAALVVLGGVAYVASNLALWRLQGKPTGPETEVRMILDALISKVRRRSA
jgi:lipopolysaccharide exporter